MIEKIVSGGQTGVDQAALDTAVQFDIAVGGWCPKGGLDENNVSILERHPALVEATTEIPDERTKLNVRDSDGTLIIVPSWPLSDNIKDGTRLTIEEAQRLGKSHLIADIADKELEIEKILNWCERCNIQVLNIGGPRESSCPGIYQNSCELLWELFSALRPKLKLS